MTTTDHRLYISFTRQARPHVRAASICFAAFAPVLLSVACRLPREIWKPVTLGSKRAAPTSDRGDLIYVRFPRRSHVFPHKDSKLLRKLSFASSEPPRPRTKAMLSLYHFPLLTSSIPIIAAAFLPYIRATDPTSLELDRNSAGQNHATNITTLAQSSDTNLSDRISFVDVIYDGVRVTRTRYRSAVFREAQAASIIGPTTNPHYLTDMRLIFSVKQGDYRSIYLEMTATWPQWGEPRLTTTVTPEDDGVLPSMFGMDIVEADRRMKAAGFGQRYDAVDIRWPGSFPIEWQQALYFFQMDGDDLDFVTVGARDGQVIPVYNAVDAVERE